MGFLRKTSRQTSKLKTLLGLAVARLATVRRPRLARRSIARGDVGQLLAIGHLDRALFRAEQVIEENNILEAFDIIELYCEHLKEQAAQLDNPRECSDEIKEAAAGLMFAAAWCGDLPELLFARGILENKFGNDFAKAAKEGAGVVDPTLMWKLSGERTSMELKKKVTKEIAAEHNIQLDFVELPEEIEHDRNNARHEELDDDDRRPCLQDGTFENAAWGQASVMETSNKNTTEHDDIRRMGTDAWSIQESAYDGISNSGGSCDGPLKPEKAPASVRTRR